MLQTRVRTGFILLFAGCLFLGFSHIPAVLLLGLAGLGALAMAELAEPINSRYRLAPAVVGTAAVLLTCALPQFWMTGLLGLLFPAYLLLGWGMMTALPGKKAFHIWEKLLLFAAVPAFLGVACRLRQREMGLYTLILPILVCAATDTFAYFVGRRFGKQPLAPNISPKKTVEGAVGGTLLAGVLVVVLAVLLQNLGLLRVRVDLLALYTLTASIIGQAGDLIMSAVKRVAGIKDFGEILPGHGGVLDRLDSCLLALPYTFLFIGCFGPIFS